ncbi:MAG: PAS domain-containing protein [Myxococcales bacterium]|nr:PAS domain-containing protein [Myxococcales bacterium]
MEPLPIQILLLTDRQPGASIVERAITDAISTSLTICHPTHLSALLESHAILGFNLICIEDSLAVDTVELLLDLKPRERRLWTIAVVPTLGNTTRIRDLFRYGAADVLLPEEVGRETLRDATVLGDRYAPPSMKGPAALLIREIVEHINGGFCTIGIDGTIGYCSTRLCEMLGCDAGYLEGRDFLSTIATLELERRGWNSVDAFPQHPFEVTLRRVDGSSLPALISCFPLNAGDDLPRAICIISDLSEIKSAQVQMQRSRRELQKKDALLGSLLKNIPQVAIAAFGVNGQIEVISDGAEHIFGRPTDELIGASFHELFEHLEQDATTVEMLAQISQRALAFSFLAPRPGDERLPCRAVMGPRLEEGVLTGFVGVCFDQKNERDLQERLIQHERLSAIGELVAGVAHDLNNPLAGIAGFCEILQSHHASGDKLQQYLSIISAQTDRCKHIVENLLSFVRPKAGEHDSVVDVNAMLDKIVELRSYHLNKYQIRLTKNYQEPLPQTTADYYRLQQVFYNLIHNAEQALRTRELPREIELATSFRDGRYQISVTDSGPGVPDRLKARIFDSFFSTKGPGKGTGLGLSIAAAVVTDHKGTIHVEDGPDGQGARFVVEFPQAGLGRDFGSSQVRRPAEALTGKRVLVIDDEPTIVSFFEEYLRSIGGAVDSADRVESAMRKLAQGSYDLVICELKLPDGSGLDLFARRSATEPNLSLRFMLSTGLIPDAATQAITDAHQIPILQKPFTLDELHAALAKLPL